MCVCVREGERGGGYGVKRYQDGHISAYNLVPIISSDV